MSRIVACIEARMGSVRLPGKSMRELCGKPLLEHLLDRIRQAKHLDEIVVATPLTKENDVIATCCSLNGVKCFRGSEDDVTERILGALEDQRADIGVEIYGDSPLSDPAIINMCIEEYLKGHYDFVGNGLKQTYPSGTHIEVYSVAALKDTASFCTDPDIRENGTLCLRQNPDRRFAIKNIEAKGSLHRPDLHLDIDEPDDLIVIEAVLKHFAPRTDFSTQEIIEFLDAHPHFAHQNQNVKRRYHQYQYQ